MGTPIEFYKMHGLGNDFIVIDGRRHEVDNWGSLAERMCHRQFGIGSDGLILVLPSEVADVRMRMFNPDGSEAEMCGNGIRCLAKFAFEQRIATGEEIAVETAAGIKRISLQTEAGLVKSITVSMGVPRLQPAEIPVLAQRVPVIDFPLMAGETPVAVTCVSMGNPHAVTFIGEDPDEFPLSTVGPAVEHHPAFPRRVNFEVCRVVGPGHLKVRVWERGAGMTLACGTGACATAVAARLKGLVDDRCAIELPGGTLAIQWDGKGEVLMTGPAEMVFRGTWLLE